jgi:hypothetical protein
MTARSVDVKSTLGAFVASSEDDAIAQAHKEAHENPEYEGWCIGGVIAAPMPSTEKEARLEAQLVEIARHIQDSNYYGGFAAPRGAANVLHEVLTMSSNVGSQILNNLGNVGMQVPPSSPI